MTFDAHKNFATSTVATAPSPATSGTSLAVASGGGANFPAVPFNAVICPAGLSPTSGNAEIIRVTAISGDTFSTIIRTQEGTNARAIAIGDQVLALWTAKTFTDLEWGAPDRQVFTASGTWTKPAGVKRVRVIGVGGGGGGGSGRRGAEGTQRIGGGGATSGGSFDTVFQADDLPATVAITIGAGGGGSAQRTTNDTDGTSGALGGNTSFGPYLFAIGGFNGKGGTAVSGTSGGAYNGQIGGASASTTGGAGVAGPDNAAFPWSPSQGGPGGSLDASNNHSAGADGAVNVSGTGQVARQAGGTAGGGAATQVGSPRSIAAALYAALPSYGGAGGGSANAADAVAGGAGGNAQGYGSGGGGGGASANGFNSGRGGDGAPGLLIVESW